MATYVVYLKDDERLSKVLEANSEAEAIKSASTEWEIPAEELAADILGDI